MPPAHTSGATSERHTDDLTLELIVQRLAYRGDLDADDQAAIMALSFTVKTMERGHFIVRGGDPAIHSCLMLWGYSVR